MCWQPPVTQGLRTSSVLNRSRKQGSRSLQELSCSSFQKKSQVTVPKCQHLQLTRSASAVYGQLEKLAASSERRHSAERASIEEFKRYLREPTCSKDQDPLAFWKETGKQHFPGLYMMAMKYMGIPATSVLSEKLFLMAGNIVTALREKMTLDHVQQLLFLHENL
ncbi:hypothetical protein HPB50_026603 [Hyalomma asiaticum]|uniref:Uncharacterized protein n=1 Tax=Hyalomma asiaticum TaxID=266040 RepID=A0ACB7TR81_HYAAI|nr:hypothetical protein HPB50_026603 [Hyalomma asiaticum]